MYAVPNAFLSCSFRQEDEPVVSLVAAVISGFGYQPVNVSSGSHRTPPAEAKSLICEAVVVVAVGTKRTRTESGFFTIPEAVRDEIAIAYALEKPTLVLLETGVNADGFLPNYGTYLQFDRENLTSVEFLKKLIASIRTLTSSAQNKSTVFKGDDSATHPEIERLRLENADLRKKIEASQSHAPTVEMRFERDVYWRGSDGPFCPNCWDDRNKAIRMLKCGNPAFSQCPTCHTAVEVNPELDV